MRSLNAGDFVFLLTGLKWTIVLSAGAFFFGGIIGVLVALARVSEQRPLRWIAIGYIRLIQGTPLLLQLFLVFFGADLMGFGLGAYLSAILGLSLNAGAFLGEIWRGAIQAVPAGQTEAARALGLHYLPIMLRIVVPQALRVATAPTVGFLVNLVKSTSLAAIIGFVELTRAGQIVNNATYRPFTIFGTVALIYFLLCFPLTVASRRLERRLAQVYSR
jgi:polar amino acid transport system permease protein